MKISDILWKAANEYLWDGKEASMGDELYASCNAAMAVNKKKYLSTVDPFLRELGCDTEHFKFRGFEYGEEQQGARYLWLMFAYLVALDEGS